MGLWWKAASRGLALDRGVNNVGPMAVSAIKALEALGVRATEDVARFPAQVTLAELEQAERIVALKQAEHLPLLQERFPAWVEKIEFWHVDDAPNALPRIEREIMSLVAHILGGGTVQETSAPEPKQQTSELAKNSVTVKVGRETKGRRGKGMTTVSEIPLDEGGLRELAGKRKHQCGTGGTVKDGRIEIQGDQRDRLVAVLESMGYRVKRVGG